jgi:hypothetical protein
MKKIWKKAVKKGETASAASLASIENRWRCSSSISKTEKDLDTIRSKQRYTKAIDDLNEMLKNYRQHWDTLQLPNLDNLLANDDISILQKQILNYVATRE